MWLWGTTIDKSVSNASQGSMYAKFEESEKVKAAKPPASPWVTIGNIDAEVPMSSAGLPVTGAAAKAEGIAGFDFDVLTQKPFRRNDIIDQEKEELMDDDRPMWTNRIEFILASMAAIWGIGNMGSFIAAMQNYGGGAFLIPYFLFYLTFSLPTLIMEMLIGQVFRRGVIVTMERIHKFFSGVGKSILFVTILYNIYFNTTTAWTLYYVIKGMWQAVAANSSYPGSGTCESRGWTGSELDCCKSSATLFHWYYEFLHLSEGPLSIGETTWYTTYDKFWPFIVIILAWVLICAFMCSGLWVKGKFPYVSLVIPLLVFLVLFAKALATWNLTVENVDEPVALLLEIFSPEFDMLLYPTTWMNAATQAFRVSLCGLGVFSTYSGYANPQYNLVKDGILISVWGMLAPLVTTLLLIPVASYYTVSDLSSLKELPTDFSLVFVIIPTVIQSLEGKISSELFGSVVVAIYFLTLLTLTMVTALAIGEVAVTTLMDIQFPNKIIPFELPHKRMTLSVAYSVISCIIGLVFGMQNGAYLFELLDQVIYPIPSMFIACAEVFAIAWIYSIYRFNDDVWLKCGYQIPIIWQQYFSWILAPGLFATFLSEVYLQFNKSILHASSSVTSTTHVASTVVDVNLTGNATAATPAVTEEVFHVSYGYPKLVDCGVSPDFRQYAEWPGFLLFIQWALIIFCALWPVWTSLSYNAETREKWRVYKHKRKYPLGIIYPVDNRGEWAMPQAYVIAQSGAAIGVGIITRFAFKYYAFGKYVFVIMCFIVHFLITLPAFILEIDLGQVFRSGPISVWKKVHPIFSGIGWCCLFINWFQAVNYMYPTIQTLDYILQYFDKLFFTKYAGLDKLITEATGLGDDRPLYLPVETQHNYPWNLCLYQMCDNANATELDCKNTMSQSLAEVYALVPDMCKYAPAIYQFQKNKIDYSDELSDTEFFKVFFGENASFADATEVFKTIKRLFIDEADTFNRYLCMGTFGVIGAITAIKPSLRHFLFGFQYIIPLFGIIVGCVYIALRGGANGKLVEMLFDIGVGENQTYIEKVLEYMSTPSIWADAGIVTMTFHAIGTGVNIAFSSYNPRDNWVNLQGMVITCYAWVGNFIFMVFYFMNVAYMHKIMDTEELRKLYGLTDRVPYNIPDIMDRASGGSYLFMATLADSLSYHKHTVAVMPMLLLCVLLNTIGSIQAIVETMATSLYGAGFFTFSRIPSCMMAAGLCTALSQVYALKNGFGFFVYQIFEKFVYGWPVPILSAIMVIAGTWVYSMYRLNNAMFMYSMHHLHYYWMFVWPFIVPMGMIGMGIFRAISEYSQLLQGLSPYLASRKLDYIVDSPNDTSVLQMYLQTVFWPKQLLYVSIGIYVLYLGPFLFTFTLVGIVNCVRGFPCKPVCYRYYEEPEEVLEDEGFNFDNIIQTPRQALEKKMKSGEDVSIHEGSVDYSDINSDLTPSESDAGLYTETESDTAISSEEDPNDPFSVRRKVIRRKEKAIIAVEEARLQAEHEEADRIEEEARMKALREERVAAGLRATPTPEPSVEDDGSMADDEGGD